MEYKELPGQQHTVKRLEAPERRSRVWIAVLVFIAALIGIAAAGAFWEKPADKSAAILIDTAEPTPEATEEPCVEPTPEPTEPPAEPSPTPPAFSKTAVVINGETVAVVASYQAAEELLRDVQRHFEIIGELPPDASTELVTKVELITVSGNVKTTTYESAFELLTGKDTPLRFISKATYFEDTVLSHKDTVIVDTKLPKGIRVTRLYGRDGVMRSAYAVVYINGVVQQKYKVESFVMIEPINGDVRIGGRVFPKDYALSPTFGNTPEAAVGLGFAPPVNGKVITYYGPCNEGFHHGIDIAVPGKTEVRAACAGTVVSVMERGVYGLMVEIEHENGVTTRYARLADVSVKIGDKVEKGQAIAKVTADDYVTHLHFELRVRGTAYNPLKVLPLRNIEG